MARLIPAASGTTTCSTPSRSAERCPHLCAPTLVDPSLSGQCLGARSPHDRPKGTGERIRGALMLSRCVSRVWSRRPRGGGDWVSDPLSLSILPILRALPVRLRQATIVSRPTHSYSTERLIADRPRLHGCYSLGTDWLGRYNMTSAIRAWVEARRRRRRRRRRSSCSPLAPLCLPGRLRAPVGAPLLWCCESSAASDNVLVPHHGSKSSRRPSDSGRVQARAVDRRVTTRGRHPSQGPAMGPLPKVFFHP